MLPPILKHGGVAGFCGLHRMGPVKQSWKRVRRFILRPPTTGRDKDVQAAAAIADIADTDDIDDMGRDFVQQMDFEAAFAIAVSEAVEALALAATKLTTELSEKASTAARKNKTVIRDQRRLRRYMWKGYATDPLFSSLQRKWHKYDPKKRVAKMASLQIPPSFLQCCPDGVVCKCDLAVVKKYVAAVGCKKGLLSALEFVLNDASRQ